MKHKQKIKYNKYIHAMTCISLSAGSVAFISKTFPQFKPHHEKIQNYINEIVPKWTHIGPWSKAVKEVDKKYNKWIKNHIPKDSKVNAIEFISAVIALLSDLITSHKNEKEIEYLEGLLKLVEDTLELFDPEDIENSELGFKLADGM